MCKRSTNPDRWVFDALAENRNKVRGLKARKIGSTWDNRITVADTSQRFELVRGGCRSRFCSTCAKPMATALRSKLNEVLKTWAGIYMLTLTLDPEPWHRRYGDNAPEQAFRYVRSKRCLARLVKALHEAGQLASRRFFYVVEFHKNGMPHWHILVEPAQRIRGAFVSHAAIASAWDNFRPKWAGPVAHAVECRCRACRPGSVSDHTPTMRPAFGAVKFSKGNGANSVNAAIYATKYLSKEPAGGWPGWLLNFKGKINRCGTSRGFWPRKVAKTGPVAPSEVSEAALKRAKKALDKLPFRYVDHQASCFCEFCREGVKAREDQKQTPKKNVRERLAACGEFSTIVEATDFHFGDGEVITQKRFLCHIPFSFSRCARYLHAETNQQGRIELAPWALRAMLISTGWQLPSGLVICGKSCGGTTYGGLGAREIHRRVREERQQRELRAA